MRTFCDKSKVIVTFVDAKRKLTSEFGNQFCGASDNKLSKSKFLTDKNNFKKMIRKRK